MYYLNCFFIYSILGFFLETLYSFFTKSNFNSGILYGPWTPIYGFGTIFILIISKYLFLNLHMPRWIETLIALFILIIFISCIELLGGILIEKIFGMVFWSYQDLKYNIGNYIALEMSIIWGIISLILIYIINPILNSFIKRIPTYFSYILIILFLLDLFITIYIKSKNN